MSKKIPYICVTPFFPSSGNWRGAYVLDQVKAIQRNSGYDVVVFLTQPLGSKEYTYEVDGVTVHAITPLLMPSYILNGMTEGLVGSMFVRTLKKLGIDPMEVAYVHCHTINHSAFGFGVKRVSPNTKVMVQFHDLDPLTLRNGRWADKRWNRRYRAHKSISAINRADLLICISEPVKDVLLSFPKPRKAEVYESALKMYKDLDGMPKLEPKDIYVLNNGVDTSLFASPQPSPEGKGVEKPLPNPPLKGRGMEDTMQNDAMQKGTPLGRKDLGIHTADPAWYGILKGFAEENRKNPTPAESMLWNALKAKGIGYKFRQQHIIEDFIVDFFCNEKKLTIELDGGYHNTPEQMISDEQRTARLKEIGYTELRFTNEVIIGNLDNVLNKIREVCKSLPSGGDLEEATKSFPSGEDLGEASEEVSKSLPSGGDLEEAFRIFRIGCIANFQELKDHITLIKAFEIFLRKMEASPLSSPKGKEVIKLSLLGSGETRAEIEKYLKETSITPSTINPTLGSAAFGGTEKELLTLYDLVEWPSEVTHDKLPEYYRTLDLFILPSVFEGFGCVYTEAYACGVPFIGVYGQGASEVIAPEERGKWLIKPHDHEQLAKLIERYYNERDRQILCKDFDIDKLIVEFLQLIEKL